MNQQWSRLFGYFVGTAIVATAVFLVPYMFGGGWLPDSITTQGDRIDALFWALTILSGVILAIVMSIVIYSIRHFRADAGDTSDGEPIHGHHKLEIVWTVIPAIIVTVIGIVSYDVMVKNEQAPATNGMTVFVRGYSFGWGFRNDDTFYSNKQLEKLELANKGPAVGLPEAAELVVPVNATVRFQVMSCSGRELVAETEVLEKKREIPGQCVRRFGEPDDEIIKQVAEKAKEPDYIPGQSGDVNHAFWVPEARMKIDSVSGLPTWTQWKPTEVTTPSHHFQVVCAELCGSGHNAMRVDACVVSRGVYAWWIQELKDGNKVPCQRLRYLTCSSRSDYTKLDAAITKLVTAKPEATCSDLEERA